MKLPYKRCSPQSSGNSGKAAGGDGTHLPVSGECILGIHQMATDAHAQAEPDRTEEIRKLPQAEELQLEHRVHLHQDGTLGVSSGGGQKVHTVCTQTVRACVYRHTGGQEEGARSIRHQQPGKGDGKEPARRDAPKHTAENKDFLRTHVHAQGHTLRGPGVPAQKGLAGECAVLQKAEDGTGADRVTHTRSHADGQDGGEQESRFPLSVSHSAERGRYGSGIPGIPVGTQGIQPAAGSTQAVPGNAVGTQHLCSQTHLGHNGLPLRDTPRNHIGSHGALLHHGDGNLSEAFQQQKD